MRRSLMIPLTIVALLVSPTVAPGQTIRPKAPYALLVDYNTGAVLFAKNADAAMSPASTTKLLTAVVVFDAITQGKLSLGDTMTISAHAAQEGSAEEGGSSMFAQPGTQVRVEDLLRGLVIDSGNDAAIALAEGVAGSEAAFAALMTKRAHQIGMSRSSFTNPWGRGDGRHRSTARDMARLAAYIIKAYPQFYGYFGERQFTWNNVTQQNRNPLLEMNIGADGLKTGHLAKSGYGLIGSAVQNGERIILVLNGEKSEKARAEEGRELLEWGFEKLRSGH
jgi:D-alanyl-D-alanine carboxypeptidase (penicillin-binding protein 5/6)